VVYWLELRYGLGRRGVGGPVDVVGGGGEGVMCLRGGICFVVNSEELICTTEYLTL
jgi:hypothetical protein